MRKILIILFISMILLTGCSKKEDLICEIGSTTVTITLKKGKIIKYVDKIKGESTNEDLDNMNNEYLKEVNNNKDAINKLREVITIMGGYCK